LRLCRASTLLVQQPTPWSKQAIAPCCWSSYRQAAGQKPLPQRSEVCA
jgi:hypothetical protein